MGRISENIKYLMRERGISANKLSTLIPIKRQSIDSYCSGKTEPRGKNLKLLADYFDVSEEWLLVGDTEIEPPIVNKNGVVFTELPNGQYLMAMPIIGVSAQAGFTDYDVDEVRLEDMPKHSVIVDKYHKGNYYAFEVSGDSMDNGTNKAICHGDIVATRELARDNWSSRLRIKERPYWIIFTQDASRPLLKQIVEHNVNAGTIRCHSLNTSPEYDDFELSLSRVQRLFYVIRITRNIDF